MFKKLPLCAAVLALCACSSAPVVKYPGGNGERTLLDGTVRSPDSPYASAARTPSPITLKRFYVEPQMASLMQVVVAWARIANFSIDWQTAIDYPLTAPMRAIREGSLDDAIDRMRAALTGVAKPLNFSIDKGRLTVSEIAGAMGIKSPDPLPEGGTSKDSQPLLGVEVRVSTLFDFGSTQLSEAGKSAIGRIAEDLRRTGLDRYVLVVGHADRLGRDDTNVLLALQRAITVRTELRRQLPASEISAEGRGSTTPLVECPGVANPVVIACLAPNRRVTVTGMAAASRTWSR